MLEKLAEMGCPAPCAISIHPGTAFARIAVACVAGFCLIILASCKTGTFTDHRDGQVYEKVKIGNQVWMAQNLNYPADSSWCYDDVPASCTTYGRLYTWSAAMHACPTGWHLPADVEWTMLILAAGGADIAGPRLMSKNGWDHDKATYDSYGFRILPAGERIQASANKQIIPPTPGPAPVPGLKDAVNKALRKETLSTEEGATLHAWVSTHPNAASVLPILNRAVHGKDISDQDFAALTHAVKSTEKADSLRSEASSIDLRPVDQRGIQHSKLVHKAPVNNTPLTPGPALLPVDVGDVLNKISAKQTVSQQEINGIGAFAQRHPDAKPILVKIIKHMPTTPGEDALISDLIIRVNKADSLRAEAWAMEAADTFRTFLGIGEGAYFWSSTDPVRSIGAGMGDSLSVRAWSREFIGAETRRGSDNAKFGFSVRCVAN